MPPPISNAQRVWDIFARSTVDLRSQFNANPSVPNIPGIAAGAQPITFFSAFVPEHVERAALVRESLNNIISNTAGNESAKLSAALDYFESLFGKENPDLLLYALRTFLLRYKGQEKFMIPSLLVREPERVTPTSVPGHVKMAIAVGSTQETKLDWFRESPCINEHHEHWHTVYDTGMKLDRQGEMFFYMHRQMIARYDVERIALSVARVQPFNDFSKKITVGYGSGPDERLALGLGNSYRDRNPNEKVSTTDAQKQKSSLSAINTDIDAGYYKPLGTKMQDETKAVNKLGSTIESNENNDTDRTRPYRGYHGSGHMGIYRINNGVMGATVFAVRDVIFWEWHKGIDDISFRWQERLDPYNFKNDAPKVELRKAVDNEGEPYSQDIILIAGDNMPDEAMGKKIGSLAFGGNKWDEDFEEGNFTYQDGATSRSIKTTRTISTNMKTGRIKYKSPKTHQPKDYPYDFLVHQPFSYFIRVHNPTLEVKRITVRIFMAPDTALEDRRMWIEMDKFLETLQPQSKTVLYRKDTASSVVAKPAVIDPSTHHTTFDPVNLPLDETCDCGWPYQMLLPKGKKEGDGMSFKLMVMISDGELDEVAGDKDCGSLSFCAARSDAYPDRRPLGYPFNRPFGAQKIMNTIRSNDNMACRTIFIKHI